MNHRFTLSFCGGLFFGLLGSLAALADNQTIAIDGTSGGGTGTVGIVSCSLSW